MTKYENNMKHKGRHKKETVTKTERKERRSEGDGDRPLLMFARRGWYNNKVNRDQTIH